MFHVPGYLDASEQSHLAHALAGVMAAAPLFRPRMPRTGKPFSVAMTNCGSLGWVSDEAGYRYQPLHPETDEPWPPIPAALLSAWRDLADFPDEPEACLVNRYDREARMGLHQDKDEAEFDAPVVSISLGDTAVFRIGGPNRSDPTRSVRLASGDAFVFGGPARLCHHGVARILGGSSSLLAGGGRLNCTLRRVSPSNRPKVTFPPG